jgi:GT2 family glycosyltransferase
MKLAIITLNYNGKKDTLDFLESLKKLQTDNLELRTIVVDNASSDGSVKEIHDKFPEVDILQTGANLGFSGGYNKGIKYAQIWGADYFLLINNDTLINSGNLLDELIKTIKSDDKIGLVSPKIYFAKGFEFHKGRYQENDLGKVIWFAGGVFDWNNIGSIHRGLDEVDKGQYDDISESEIFSGACVLIKKEVFEKVGLLDEKYFLYFEDSDFGKRATESGFKKYYNGKVSIFHKVSQSTGIGSEITDYYHSRNRLIFGMEYGKGRTKFALFREALWQLVFGRVAQKEGILDYFKGKTGDKNIELDKPKGEYPFKLSIGIVNYNTANLTKKLLMSIFNSKSGFDEKTMEVIVLDNGHIDPAKDLIKEYLPRIKYLENKENEGFSKGYNKTIRFSLGEYYLMLNSDIEALDNSLSEVVSIAEEFKGKAVLGAKLIFPNGIVQDSAFNLPTITGALKEYFLRQKGAYFMYAPENEKQVKVEGAAMAAYLIPRKIFQKVGLLDENIFILFEDVEYARRLKKYCVPIYFVPQIKFLHHHGASTKKQGITKSYEQLKASSMYYHGKIYYWLLYYTLLFCQKFSGTKTPGEIR